MQLPTVLAASFAGTTMEQDEGVDASGAGSFVVQAASNERSSMQAAPSAKSLAKSTQFDSEPCQDDDNQGCVHACACMPGQC